MFDLALFLREAEWYDNHRLGTILDCPRKAFYHMVYRGGLEGGVGPGAGFGSAVHSALAAYYNPVPWRDKSEPDRRLLAYRSFAKTHALKFGSDPGDLKKHSLDNGLRILDEYFDTFLLEDRNWRPIAVEMAAIVPVLPQPGDPSGFQKPFYIVMRADGLWEKVSTGEWFVEETKTTGGPPDREATRLVLSRQTRTYTWGFRQFPNGHRIVGVVANILEVLTEGSKVAHEKGPYIRDIRYLPEGATASWRAQTIRIVEAWRVRLDEARGKPAQAVLDLFEQNDHHCTNYGLCAFFKVCVHGLPLAEAIPKNTWTPFEVEEVPA